ncbi:cytochrome P450 [Embleya sp. AB8]|uniref:cytochrome P450 n=1 Tax=Embleya sp. AB8 TaxID=3156304 RepID=UPI003C765339
MFTDRLSLWPHLRRWERLAVGADRPFRLRHGTVFVADAAAARAILVDSAAHYVPQSGFFRIGPEPLPRSLRAAGTHGLLAALGRHDLPSSFDLDAAIGELSDRRGHLRHQRWGVPLVRRYFAPAIAYRRPAELDALIDAYVTSSVVADDIVGRIVRPSHGSVDGIRAGFTRRLSVLPAPGTEVREDLVDVVLGLPGELSVADRAQLLQRLILSTVGFTGVTLEWVVLLGIRHGYNTPAVRPDQVRSLVRETLRLYPTAWRLGRQAAVDHKIGGVAVREGEHVLVGTHAIHRSGAVWDEPSEFRPARWESPNDEQRRAYLPFGKGAEMCPANGFAVKALEHLAHLILRDYEGRVQVRRWRPHVRTLLAPPPGRTRLTRRPTDDREAARRSGP